MAEDSGGLEDDLRPRMATARKRFKGILFERFIVEGFCQHSAPNEKLLYLSLVYLSCSRPRLL